MNKENEMETREHIDNVRKFINILNYELIARGIDHDQSKLEFPEKEIFEEYTPKLKETTYGSIQYQEYLKEMKIATDHHYLVNRHHPEHFSNTFKCEDCGTIYTGFQNECDVCHHFDSLKRVCDISKMNLIDLIEMICDWKAATLRHNNGDIYKSIEINRKRFNISDQLTSILFNTIELFEGEKESFKTYD